MELSKAKISLYSRLSNRKVRDEHRLFMAEGRKCVHDLLPFFEVVDMICVNGSRPDIDLPATCPVYSVAPNVMKKLSSLSTPSEITAVFRIPSSFRTVLPEPAEGLNLLLDGLQDPGNLGTLIRTAHWFGVKRIYASNDTVDLFNPKTVQATMGSLGHVDVVYCDLISLISANPGMPVYGTLLDGEDIYKATLGGRGFIIMGNEGKGISLPLRPLITDPLLIPPFDPGDHSESLNVAIATAVTLSQFRSRM